MTTTDDDDLTVLQTTGREARQGPGAWNSAMPTESSRDFRATVRRLATVVGDEIPNDLDNARAMGTTSNQVRA